MKEELEQAKNDFYSGNNDTDSQDVSRDMHPSLLGENDQSRPKGSESIGRESQSYPREDSSKDVMEDFDEELWLQKWVEENPEVLIPKEKLPAEDLDLDPEFDLDSFHID